MTDSEQQEVFDFLVTRFGADEEEARRMMRDDDLWLIGPDLRPELPDVELLEEYRKAIDTLPWMVEIAEHIGLGIQALLLDALQRAHALHERTQERVRQAREQG